MSNLSSESMKLHRKDENYTWGSAGVGFPELNKSISGLFPKGGEDSIDIHLCSGQIIHSSVSNMPVGTIVLMSHSLPTCKPDATDMRTSDHPELAEALMDLYGLKSIAVEEGEVAPDDETIDNADTLLRKLFRVSPRPYYVYTMPDGDIAIDAHSPRDTKLVLVCSANGSARCLFYFDDKMAREKYDDLSEIPSTFILDALEKTQN